MPSGSPTDHCSPLTEIENSSSGMGGSSSMVVIHGPMPKAKSFACCGPIPIPISRPWTSRMLKSLKIVSPNRHCLRLLRREVAAGPSDHDADLQLVVDLLSDGRVRDLGLVAVHRRGRALEEPRRLEELGIRRPDQLRRSASCGPGRSSSRGSPAGPAPAPSARPRMRSDASSPASPIGVGRGTRERIAQADRRPTCWRGRSRRRGGGRQPPTRRRGAAWSA